jgi:hypothetical protein
VVFQTTTGSDHVLDEVGMKWPRPEWHVVSVPAPDDPKIAPHYKGWSPCMDWCFEQFGSHTVDGWGYVGEGVFEFREEKHAAWFLMRWQ